MTTRRVVIVIASFVALGAVVGLVLVVGFPFADDAPKVVVSKPDGSSVEDASVRKVSDATLVPPASGAREVTPVFDVEAPEAELPVVLRFSIPANLDADQRSRLVVADQRLGGGGWILTPAELDGNEVVYRAEHLSYKQVLELPADLGRTARDAALGAYDFVAEAVGARADGTCSDLDQSPITIAYAPKSDAPPVLGCPEFGDDGRARVTLVNQRGIAWELSLPPDARVESASTPELSEFFWQEVYAAVGNENAWLPAGGVLTVSFQELPAKLDLSADPTAFTTDLVVRAGAAGRLGKGAVEASYQAFDLAQCVSSTARSSSSSFSDQTADEIWDEARDVWSQCGGVAADLDDTGGGIGAFGALGELLFGLPADAIGLLDTLRAVPDGQQSIQLTSAGGGVIRTPSAGYRHRFDLRFTRDEGEQVDMVVEVGALTSLADDGGSVACVPDLADPARTGILRGYMSLTAGVAEGFELDVTPGLEPGRFHPPRRLGDPAIPGGGDMIVQEPDGSCNPLGLTPFGYRTIPGGATTGPLEFTVVFLDLFSPAVPQGDPDELRRLTIGPSAGLGWKLECVDGPGTGLGPVLSITGQDTMALAEESELPTYLPTPSCSASVGTDEDLPGG